MNMAVTIRVRLTQLGTLYDLPAWREGRPGFGLFRVLPADLTGVVAEIAVGGGAPTRMVARVE